MAVSKKMTMAEYIREMNYQIPMDRICRNLGISGISDGHLTDTETVVEVNSKMQVMAVNGKQPKAVKLDRAEEIEVVPEDTETVDE